MRAFAVSLPTTIRLVAFLITAAAASWQMGRRGPASPVAAFVGACASVKWALFCAGAGYLLGAAGVAAWGRLAG